MRKLLVLSFALTLCLTIVSWNGKSSAQKASRLASAGGEVIVKLKAKSASTTIDASKVAPQSDQLFAVAAEVGANFLRADTSDAVEPLVPTTSKSRAGEIIAAHGLDRTFVLKFDPQADLEAIINDLKANPEVEYAEPNVSVTVGSLIPNDPGFGEQWALRNLGIGVGGFPATLDADIKATQAWEITTGSPDVLVAVTDTGVDINHPDLAPNIYTNPREIPNNNIDDDNNGYVDDVHGYNVANKNNDVQDVAGHGTQMSGIIAAKLNNTVGIGGVSQSKIIPVKFFRRVGPAPDDIRVSIADAARALLYSISAGAHIINASWSSGLNTLSDEEVQTLRDAVSATADAGVLLVTIAGNEAYNLDVRNYYPAKFRSPNQIVVAASQYNDELWHQPFAPTNIFSGFGKTTVDLAAPGMTIFTTAARGDCSGCTQATDSSLWYATIDGTSASAAYVSGVAALIKSRFPDANYVVMKRRLLESVDVRDPLKPYIITGGRLNALNALTIELTTISPVLAKLKIKPNGKTFIIGDKMQDGATLLVGNKAYPARFKNGDFTRLVTSVSPADFPPGVPVQTRLRNPDGGESNLLTITK
jgi:subtilisin family serine protease